VKFFYGYSAYSLFLKLFVPKRRESKVRCPRPDPFLRPCKLLKNKKIFGEKNILYKQIFFHESRMKPPGEDIIVIVIIIIAAVIGRILGPSVGP
jgi:hypothetical protein